MTVKDAVSYNVIQGLDAALYLIRRRVPPLLTFPDSTSAAPITWMTPPPSGVDSPEVGHVDSQGVEVL